MCNRVDNEGISIQETADRLRAEIVEGNYQFAKELSAFDRPAIPVVLDYQGRKVTHGTWGIKKEIPKDRPAQGINLTAEKTHTFYKTVEHNRCVIPVSGFYDWMHVTNPGKKTPIKVKHRMRWKEENQFYIAGFYDVWDNKEIGFGLVTTVSNELMSIIHNSKLRMPICLNSAMADKFLNDEPIEEFTFPTYDPHLIAVNLEPGKMPQTLFD